MPAIKSRKEAAMPPIPTRCSDCTGPLVEATPATTDRATMETIRKRLGSLRTTPMHRLVAYVCQKCGRVYFFARERDI